MPHTNVKNVARIMSALSHPLRLKIVQSLLDGPCIVNDIVAEMGIDQTAVSKHLAILRKAGLVSCEAEGRCRIYSVTAEGSVRQMLTVTHTLEEELCGGEHASRPECNEPVNSSAGTTV